MTDMKMPDINEVVIAGRLTRDPELRYGPSGDAVCNISVAVSRKYKTKDGQSREDTCFVNCTCWRKQAEWVGEHLRKGRPVHVTGSLKTEEWNDKGTGQKRTALKLEVRRIQALDWDEDGKSDAGRSERNSASPKPREEEPSDVVPEDDIPF